ncbi:MAG: 3-hydroxyacyl-ACP dehydratase FabZ family protein [Pseudomonadota bacterium]
MNKTAHWTVPLDHPAFAGHFPGTPILPGVVLLDTALQAIAQASGIALDLCEISSVKFLSPANPGDALLIQHEISASGTIRFEIVAGTRKIASGSIVAKSPI